MGFRSSSRKRGDPACGLERTAIPAFAEVSGIFFDLRIFFDLNEVLLLKIKGA